MKGYLELLDGSLQGQNLLIVPLFFQLLSSSHSLFSCVIFGSFFSQLLLKFFILLLQIINLGLL